MVMDTFGCTPAFIEAHPEAVKGMVDGYFDALAVIEAEPAKSFELMGADVKQTGEQFAASAKFLRWQDRAANKVFFDGPIQEFSAKAADLLLELGIIRSKPDIETIIDTRFIGG